MSSILPREHEQACPARGSGATHSPPSSSPRIFPPPHRLKWTYCLPHPHPLKKEEEEEEEEGDDEEEEEEKKEKNVDWGGVTQKMEISAYAVGCPCKREKNPG